MKANYHITAEILDNTAQFSDAFFQQFSLRHNHQALRLTDSISKDYLFPTFYSDVSCAIAVFLCNYASACTVLPHPAMKPVRMPGNRAIVTFSCYEYRHVLNVAPYNEIAMTIPVQVDPFVDIPVLPMLMEKQFKKFGYHVFHMPVTSLENCIRGNKIWGLPKVVNDIIIQPMGVESEITAVDEAGNQYFRLRVPTTGKPQQFDVKSNLYSKLGNRLLQSQTAFKGNFNVNKFMSRLWQHDDDKADSVLSIGEGPQGDLLRSLGIESRPFQFRYSHSMNACFDLPNDDYAAPFIFGDSNGA